MNGLCLSYDDEGRYLKLKFNRDEIIVTIPN